MLKIATLLALVLPFASANILAGEPCFSGTVDATTDLFPHKSVVSHSKLWEIEYFGTYKIVKYLRGTGESYILKQCGTELPATVVEADYNGTVIVPLTGKIGLASTTMIPFVEALGLRSEIGVHYTPVRFISSPCVLQNIALNNTIVSPVTFPAPDFNRVPADVVENITLNFIDGYGGYEGHAQTIGVSEWAEQSLLAQAEYIKFYAAFWNMEEEGNAIFDENDSRFSCISEVSQKVQAVKRKTMAWGQTQFANAWSVAMCDPEKESGNYYCELATAAGIDLLSVPSFFGDHGSIKTNRGALLNNTEFEAWAKDADILVIPDNSPTFEELIVEHPWLSNLKAVKSGDVYDNLGRGSTDWLESRPMRPASLLADFAYIAADTGALDFEYKLEYLRKVDATLPGNAGVCVSLDDEFVIGNDFECADLESDLSDDDGAASSTKVQGLVAAVAGAAAWITMM